MSNIPIGISIATPFGYNITEQEEKRRVEIIKNALENDLVIPYYQGLYNNKTNRIDKYEALMRIGASDGTMYSPYEFMFISKKYNLYLELNLAMFRAVFKDFSSIDCSFSINVSPYHLTSPKFCEMLLSYVENFNRPSNVVLEILEDECAIDTEQIEPFVKKIRALGAKIAIDDYGAGYSNLLSVLKLKPDFLKIDGKIVKDVGKYIENEVVMEAVSQMGHKLNISLVAEYVENEEIQNLVAKHGIMYSQGYYFAKPVPFSEVYAKEMKN